MDLYWIWYHLHSCQIFCFNIDCFDKGTLQKWNFSTFIIIIAMVSVLLFSLSVCGFCLLTDFNSNNWDPKPHNFKKQDLCTMFTMLTHNLLSSLTIFSIGSEGGFPPSSKSFPPILKRIISGDDIAASMSSISSSTSSDS